MKRAEEAGDRFCACSVACLGRLSPRSPGLAAPAFSAQPGLRVVTFSPDGALIAFAVQNSKNIEIRKVVDGSLVNTIPAHKSFINALMFSPDGSLIASAASDGTVCLWQVIDGDMRFCFRESTRSIQALDFSSDGKIIAAGGGENTVVLWSTTDGSRLRSLSGHTEPILTVSFSPDDSLLLSSGKDQRLSIWRTDDGKRLATINPWTESTYNDPIGAFFSPDGTQIYTLGYIDQVLVWQVP